MLAVIGTHPVQYHAPVYRALQNRFGIPVTAIYGSDFSVAGYQDREFGASFAWDTDLLSGYQQVFLSRVSEGGGRGFDEVSTQGLERALQRIKPQAVLLPGYSTHFDQTAFYKVWKNKLPILFRGETTDHSRSRSMLKTLVRDSFLRLCYRQATRLLYIGKRSYQHYRRLHCPDEKLVFSPYCVDLAPFEVDESARAQMRTKLRQELNISEEQIVLLFSGKLSYRKGPELILQAVKQLPATVQKKVVVIFLGSGCLAEELKVLSKKQLQVKALFPGFQNQTHLSQYYHSSDLMILPSRQDETWGLVVNEALHHGLPCVVSDAVGCAPDLIDDGITGHTFASDSAHSLAFVLGQALKLIGRDEVRRDCRQKVSSYGIEDAAKGIAEAYWQLGQTVISNE